MVDADAAAHARGDDDRAVLVDTLDVELGAAGERRILDLAVELRLAVIAVGEAYSSRAAAIGGIDSIRRNASEAQLADQTEPSEG